jgi:hypothetical protein
MNKTPNLYVEREVWRARVGAANPKRRARDFLRLTRRRASSKPAIFGGLETTAPCIASVSISLRTADYTDSHGWKTLTTDFTDGHG